MMKTIGMVVALLLSAAAAAGCRAVPAPAAATSATAPAEARPTLPMADGPFKPDWDSLRQYRCPEWFRDAKFGIWAHWGPQSVTGAGDWYARQMYVEGTTDYKFHLKHYGHPSVLGYKDIVPLWKAENFDPDRLMEKYKNAGAKYFVSMGVHHDNFDLWNSRYHAWNAVKMGPKKDIVGLWAAAAHKQGLRFGVSEHLERSYSWFNTNKGADKTGPKAGVPYDGNDPKYADFYFPPHDDDAQVYPLNPPDWWKKQWSDRIQDLVDQYHPDLLYTDGGIPFDEVGRSLLAHFYNQNIKQHAGQLEAVYNIKNIPDHRHGDYVEGVAVEDLERRLLKGIKDAPWQTDTSIGDWFYRPDDRYKTATTVIHMLVDVVSKNGNLLINFTQRPDGILSPESENVLDELAAWMPINGEAIFATRPWRTYGEGAAQGKDRNFSEGKATFTAADIRFTRSKDGHTLYAILLGVPAAPVRIQSLAGEKIARITLLGSAAPVQWKQEPDALVIAPATQWPCQHAVAYRVTLAP